jgi:hypothetical protein
MDGFPNGFSLSAIIHAHYSCMFSVTCRFLSIHIENHAMASPLSSNGRKRFKSEQNPANVSHKRVRTCTQNCMRAKKRVTAALVYVFIHFSTIFRSRIHVVSKTFSQNREFSTTVCVQATNVFSRRHRTHPSTHIFLLAPFGKKLFFPSSTPRERLVFKMAVFLVN